MKKPRGIEVVNEPETLKALEKEAKTKRIYTFYLRRYKKDGLYPSREALESLFELVMCWIANRILHIGADKAYRIRVTVDECGKEEWRP